MSKDIKIKIDLDSKEASKNMKGLGQTVGGAEKEFVSLNEQVKSLKKEMQGLDVGSAKFMELAQEAGVLEDKLGKINAATAVFASDTLTLDTTIGVVQGVASAYGAVQGAMALAGVENEKLMQVLVRLQAIQSLVNGVQQFSNMINSQGTVIAGLRVNAERIKTAVTRQSTAATVTATAATGVQTIATGAATVATTALAVAMNALPFVAIITAIGFIVNALYDWASASDEAVDSTDALKDATDQLAQAEAYRQQLSKSDADLSKANLNAQISKIQGAIKLLEIEKQSAKTAEEQLAIDKQIYEKNKQILGLKNEISNVDESANNAALEKSIQLRNEQVAATKSYVEKLKEASSLFLGGFNNDSDIVKIVDDFKLREDALEKIRKAQTALNIATEKSITLAKDSNTTKQDINDANEKRIEQENIIFDLIEKIDEQTSEIDKSYAKLTDGQKEYFDDRFKFLGGLDLINNEISKNYFETFKTQINEEIKLNTEKVKIITEQQALATQGEIDLQTLAAKQKAALDKKQQDERKDGLKQMLDEEKRNAEISVQIEKHKISQLTGIDKQLAEEKFETAQAILKIEEQSIASHQKVLEEMFVKGETSWEEFHQHRLNLTEFANDSLLQEERDLVDKMKEISLSKQQMIKLENYFEIEASKAKIKQLTAQREQLALDVAKAKELELLKEQLRNDQLVDENKKLFSKKKTQLELFETQSQLITDSYRAASKDAIQARAAADLAALDVKYQQEQQKFKDNAQKLLELETEYLLNREKINADTSTAIAALNEEVAESAEDNWFKTWLAIELGAQETIKALNSIMNVMNVNTTNAVNNLQDLYKADSQALNDSLNNKLISQEEHDNQLAALEKTRDAEAAALKQKQFNREKKLRVATTLIDTASATMRAWANPGFPLAIPLTALIATQSAFNVAAINNEVFTAAKGGVVPGKPSNVDSVDAYLAPGEAVINAKSTQAFLPLLSAINTIGGGIPLTNDISPSVAPSIGTPESASNFKVLNKESAAPTIKAYVTSYDINKSQKDLAKRRKRTTIK